MKQIHPHVLNLRKFTRIFAKDSIQNSLITQVLNLCYKFLISRETEAENSHRCKGGLDEGGTKESVKYKGEIVRVHFSF